MDSFYELSRQLSVKHSNSNNMPLRPMVPDVSMLENPPKSDNHLSYSAWKYTQVCKNSPQATSTNIVNVPSYVQNSANSYTPAQISNSILRKQVRFQSPTLQHNNNNVFESNDIFGPKNVENKVFDFENVYWANIPNRKLDLSIIEPPLSKGKKMVENRSKFAQSKTKLDAPVYDILNYKSQISNKSENMQKIHSNCNSTMENSLAQINCDESSTNECGLEGYKINHNYENCSQSRLSGSMTNVPSRHTCINDSPKTTIENYKATSISQQYLDEEKSDELVPCKSSAVSNTALIPSCNIDNTDQPTVRDLLKIIQQQNDQLLILQKQVATLIDNQQTHQRAIESQQDDSNQKKAFNEPTFQVFDNDNFCPNKINKSIVPNKFNIDVMTSFEVSIRPQHKPSGRPFDGGYPEAKIQEVTEEFDSHLQLKDVTKETDRVNGRNQARQIDELSLMLGEPLQVQEGRMSPDQSVHVDMHDYNSDSDCESNDSSDLGWTIYNNVMGQVNNILTKANVAKMDQLGNQQTSNKKIRSKTMKKVKEATLRHLQSIGVHIPMSDTSDSLRTQNSTDGLDYSPSEVSFAVQQLLMKYLPSEHLAKLPNIPQNTQNGINMTNCRKRNKNEPKVNFLSRRPEFSFATLQYMQKYNLISSLEDETVKMMPPQKIQPVQQKFLDITALKQQPKLL